MATQTLSADQNYDDAAISGLVNGDDITLAGFTLTMNSDSRWGQQAAVFGNTTYSSTIGGDILIDGTKVWWMAYDAPSGNVPALGVAGVQNCSGGSSLATGDFLGIWSSIPGAPVAAGGSIPSNGWVKFRSKVGTFQDNETVSLPGGASITVNSSTGGQRGWLHIVGEAGNNVSVPRLGSHITTGDWFELGTTNGSDDQTINIPVLDHVPAIWVEKTSGSGEYEIWLNGGTRWGTSTQFIPTDIRGKYFGQWREVVANATNTSAVVTTTDTSGFVVGMPVNNVNNAAALTIQDGCSITSITPGVSITLSKTATATAAINFRSPRATITIAQRASNSCGYKPASGLKIRVPNIWMSTSDSSLWTGNQSHIGVATRYEMNASTAGTITVDKANILWYHNVSGAYKWWVTNCGCSLWSIFNLGNFATPMKLNDCGIGLDGLPGVSAIAGSAIPFGGEIKRNRASRGVNTTIADRTITISDCANFNIDYNTFEHFGGLNTVDRGFGDNRMIEATRMTDCTFDNNTFIGGIMLISQGVRSHCRNHIYADRINGTTNSTVPLSPITYQAGCVDCTISGLTLLSGLTNVHPYNPLIVLLSSCERIKVREVGTATTPIAAGSANKCFGVITVNNVFNCEINRIYMDDARTFVINGANNSNNIVIDNVWGGYASSNYVNPLNSTARGMRCNTFTSGQSAVYGSHWSDMFTTDTTGRILIACNEPTVASASQCTVTSGSPLFTSAGSVSMPSVGDQVTWEMPYFALGYTSLDNLPLTATGTNTGNFSFEFQYNKGSDYNGTWHSASGANLSGAGAITPTTGIKLKVRATTTVAAADNALVYLNIYTFSNTTAMQTQYPYQFDSEVSVTPIVSGSHIQLYNVTKASELYNGIPGTSLTYEYYNGIEISSGDNIRLRVRKNGKEDVELNTTATVAGASFLVSQETDPHCTGATISNYTVDFVNKKIRATGSRASFTCQEVADIICTEQATTDGIRLAPFAAITGLVTLSPGVQTGLTVNLIDWQVSWAAGSVTQASITSGNLVGGITNDPVEDISGGPQVTINLSAAATSVATSGTTRPTASEIATAVRAELATELARMDAVISSRATQTSVTSIATNTGLIPALL